MKTYTVVVDEWVARSHYVTVEAENEDDALNRVSVVVDPQERREEVDVLSDGRLWNVEGIQALDTRDFDDLSNVSLDVWENV